MKLRQKNEKFKVNNIRRVNKVINKNLKFYIDIAINFYIYYDKDLFNKINLSSTLNK